MQPGEIDENGNLAAQLGSCIKLTENVPGTYTCDQFPINCSPFEPKHGERAVPPKPTLE